MHYIIVPALIFLLFHHSLFFIKEAQIKLITVKKKKLLIKAATISQHNLNKIKIAIDYFEKESIFIKMCKNIYFICY